MKAEEQAMVLDFLPHGRSTGFKSEPVALVLGTDYFTLLEVIPKTGVELKVGETVLIGKDSRDKVEYIKRRVSFNELTSSAVSELENMVEKIVLQKEQQFVDFFNTSRPITLKRHQLELLSGLGKKHLFEILKVRESEPFKSFDDIKKKVHMMPDVVHMLVKRITEEISGEDEKHYLFVRPPVSPQKSGFERHRFRKY
ncbi:MAG: DUF655 domain-containing protein [Candidatus Diapherotrites archaeon]|nr:DUF655 domain-containing protein [Candidatus Diapherotrites archaeon]